MHRSCGTGSVSPAAKALGRHNGLTVSTAAALMFDPTADGAHKAMCVVFKLPAGLGSASRRQHSTAVPAKGLTRSRGLRDQPRGDVVLGRKQAGGGAGQPIPRDVGAAGMVEVAPRQCGEDRTAHLRPRRPSTGWTRSLESPDTPSR